MQTAVYFKFKHVIYFMYNCDPAPQNHQKVAMDF